MNYKEIAALNKAQWAKDPRPMKPVPQWIQDIPREEWTKMCFRGQKRQRKRDRRSDRWQARWVESNTRRFFWGVIF